MPEPVKISGIFTGFTDGNPPLAGILIAGGRQVQKWLVCDDPNLLGQLRNNPPAAGRRITVMTAFRPETGQMELTAILSSTD